MTDDDDLAMTLPPGPMILCRLCLGAKPKLRMIGTIEGDLVCDSCWQPPEQEDGDYHQYIWGADAHD